MAITNGKTVRVLTVATDAEGVIVGCGISRPLTPESALKRAAKGFGSMWPASTLVQGQRRIVVCAEEYRAHHTALDTLGQHVSSIKVAREGGAQETRP